MRPIRTDIPSLDHILEQWRGALGADFTAYRNHCYRVYNFCRFLSCPDDAQEERLAVAVAFHDLGIWAFGTFDYLAGSQQLASEYLTREHGGQWISEVQAMIANHHKLTRCGQGYLVEAFRKADWLDVSLGIFRFGLSRRLIGEVRAAFPNAGFHNRLVGLIRARARQHPFSPLPMLRF